MVEAEIIANLRAWRRASGLSQEKLAARLRVSQAAVSRWEAGLDVPSFDVVARIRALIDPRAAKDLAVEELFVREQGGLRILFDLDGATLLAASRGYARVFPRFSRLVGQRFADRLVGETSIIYEDPSTYSAVKLGEIGLMTGTTRRHIDHPADEALKHHWTICFRRLGHRIVGDVSFELCSDDAPVKLDRIVRLDEVAR